MDYFYKQCIETLFKPFGDIPEFKGLTGEHISHPHLHAGLTEVGRFYPSLDEGKDQPLPLPLRLAMQLRSTTLLPQPFFRSFV